MHQIRCILPSSGSINSFKLRDVVGFTGVAGSSYRVKWHY